MCFWQDLPFTAPPPSEQGTGGGHTPRAQRVRVPLSPREGPVTPWAVWGAALKEGDPRLLGNHFSGLVENPPAIVEEATRFGKEYRRHPGFPTTGSLHPVPSSDAHQCVTSLFPLISI